MAKLNAAIALIAVLTMPAGVSAQADPAAALQLRPIVFSQTMDLGPKLKGLNMITYGVNSSLKFGGASSISGMMYASTPKSGNDASLTRPLLGSNKPPVKEIKSDKLILQNADLGLGNVRVKLGIQDVGKDFAGFGSLRDSKAATDASLKRLEKEKGIQRLDMAAEIPMSQFGGFSFAFGEISDKQDKIINRIFGFTSDNVAFNYGMRDVGKQFSRFGDLKEADRAQLAAEAGASRTVHGMQFSTGLVSEGAQVWNSLNVSEIRDPSGSLSEKSADLDFGGIKVRADIRTADPEFDKMAALNDEERTRMALNARRQFDPKARASDVTSADKAKLNNERGLDRANYALQWNTGPVTAWVSLENIDSQKGGVNRTSFNLEGKRFKLNFTQQAIDMSFDRISSLQAVEVASFGNERGMSRTSLGGSFALGFGELQFNQTSVDDHDGATMLRQSFHFQNSRLKFRGNFQNIGSNFTRILDLSDADREALRQDRGFKRADYAINFQGAKALNIDSYIYDSSNLTAGQTRNQARHAITYAPARGPKVTALSDERAYLSEAGNLSSYSRQRITFDNNFSVLGGLLFKTVNDVNTSWEGEANPITTETTQTRLESNQNAPTSFTADSYNMRFGDGRFENTQAMGVKTRVTDRFAVIGSMELIETENKDNSGTFGAFGLDWKLSKDLKMTANVTNVGRGSDAGKKTRQFSLNGALAKRFLIFNDVTVGSGINQASARGGKQSACDNAFKIQAGVYGGAISFDNTDKLNPSNGIYYTSRLFQYESDKDPKKRYHIKYFKQNLVTPQGTPARKRDYAVDARLTRDLNFTYVSYFGKNGQNGAALPVGGTIFKLSRAIGSNVFSADYSSNLNEVTKVSARIIGLGFTGTLSDKATLEFYYGYARLIDNGIAGATDVFKIKYDRKIDDKRFISLSAQKKSGVDKTEINPNEGNTVARIDFRTLFH